MMTKHQYFDNEQNSQNPLDTGKIFVTSNLDGGVYEDERMKTGELKVRNYIKMVQGQMNISMNQIPTQNHRSKLYFVIL
jgi:hypothetical protein